MTLPRSRALLGAGRGDGLADEGLDRGVVELLGQVLGEDRDLRLLLRREVLAAALPERLDGLAAGLHLAGQDRPTRRRRSSSRRSRFSTV